MDDAELQRMVEELDLSTQEIKEMIIQAQEETETELTKLEGEIDQELQHNSLKNDPPIDET
jgi:hypothetical protein